MQTSANIRRTSANKGQQYANVCKHSEDVCKPRPAAAIPCGPVGVRSSDQRRAGTRCSPLDGSMGTYLQFPRVISADRASSCDPHGRGLDAQPWILGPEVCTTPDLWPAVCTTMDPRAGSLHNPGSNGRKYEVCRRLQTFGERLQTKPSSCDPLRAGWQFDRVINAGPVCSCGPVLDAVPSIDTRGTYLQFPRVINADRASSCDPLRAGWQFDLVINAGLVLDAVPSIDQRRPGQQYAIPCEPVGVPSSDQRRPGQQYAQPWIHGPG